MLKKAGIIVAAATAAVLAVSPLAFATEGDNNNGTSSKGLFNVSDNNGAFAGQVCNNDVPIQGGFLQGQVPVKEITGAASGAAALLGIAYSSVDQDTDNSRECGDNTADAGDENTQDVG